MNEAIKLMSEQLRSNTSGVAEKEGQWRTLLSRVFEDTAGVFTEEERKELHEACRVYDRAKLFADVLELVAYNPHMEAQTTKEASFHGRSLAQIIEDHKNRGAALKSGAYTVSTTLTGATISASSDN